MTDSQPCHWAMWDEQTKAIRRMSTAEVFGPERAYGWEFYQRPTVEVAWGLLGAVLVKREPEGLCAARLVELEAYLPDGDAANHAARGWSERTAPMFAAGGILYVYAIYGRHRCVNVVTEPEGRPGAVLLRAAEVLHGEELMRRRRGEVQWEALCRGPANLARAFGFELSDNFRSVCSAELFIVPPPEPIAPEAVRRTPRIGISRARELPLRFVLWQSRCRSR
jgi:DNA-3-methyladenine glycosylase